MHGPTATASRDGQKSQPWKKFWPPQDGVAAQIELTPEEMNLQRSYGTHASNTKGKIFAIDKKPKCKYVDGAVIWKCWYTTIAANWVGGKKLFGLEGEREKLVRLSHSWKSNNT